ncbi:MAG TPA: hypothetical protein DCS07_09090 [Bdellovibrionales bacterium]|nr:MAG: hypothetical protein A2Z97_12700 [Bdellovibrionales bacterium GWB1_52_6]OFZ02857.1 MAG: hypothetical protein A2X97_04600 [Bdellovibrionales bacterium GWA1_52_35]OFZ40243.1 MAG: hypothetical protein A2070_10460 [Bdellovibrionales bacterium GWC1_52_8]HAR42764.1 hypothetical protein [Bdellovibrionales bacterium]HCM38439.1 hypothetical protein [Bdellovibrionales bacterium]
MLPLRLQISILAVVMSGCLVSDSVFAENKCLAQLTSAFLKATRTPTEDELIQDAVKNRRFWLDPKLNVHFEANPELVPALARHWYESEALPQSVYPKVVSAVGKKRAHLMLDPRIVCRIDQFLAWSTTFLKTHPEATANELRSSFAASLGQTKVFRGMRLGSAVEAAQLKSQGILASGLRTQNEQYLRNKMKLELDPSIIDHKKKQDHLLGFGTDLRNRQINRGLDHSMLISTSDWIEIAASVGYHHPQAVKMSPAGRLYLFEIDIPEFELVRKAGPLSSGHAYRKGSGSYQIGNKSIEYDEFKVESFIPYEIRPEWISNVHHYQDAPPKWEFKR